MIVMNVMLDNLFDFHDFSVNFSYPKKLVKSTIEHEYIKTKPNFRYKKVNIINVSSDCNIHACSINV